MAEAPEVRLADGEFRDGSLFQTYNPDEHKPRELVPSMAAGIGGSAEVAATAIVPNAGSLDPATVNRPTARVYTRGAATLETPPLVRNAGSADPASTPGPRWQEDEASKRHAPAPLTRSVTPIRRDRALDGRRPRSTVRRSSENSGDSGSDPDEPSPSRRLTGREDIEHWLDERRRTLTALTAQDSPQLALTELTA